MALEAGEKMADALSHLKEGLLLFTPRWFKNINIKISKVK